MWSEETFVLGIIYLPGRDRPSKSLDIVNIPIEHPDGDITSQDIPIGRFSPTHTNILIEPDS
jgi:hypothetical protein